MTDYFAKRVESGETPGTDHEGYNKSTDKKITV